MLRFSKNFKVLYVNDHSFNQFFRGFLHKEKLFYKVNDNLTVYSPFAFPTFQKSLSLSIYLNKILLPLLAKNKTKKINGDKLILWLYHPRYINLIGKFKEELVIYDCMDDFTSLISPYEDREKNFKDERELLKRADIVFAGGYSIADLKKKLRKDIHVFPSAVDTEHFKKALLDSTEIPDDIKDIKHPILGYWGAIDERINHRLLESLALRHPDWSIVLLGPIVKQKIKNISYLDRVKNIFWLGAKEYSLLPNYAKAFDICLNPFIMTREGKHLSPTKTLEYLATGKPVISTPIIDVVKFYEGIVNIADNLEKFEMEVKRCLKEEADETMKLKRISFTANKTWEDTIRKMEELIINKIKNKPS
ncbi:MAG: glycosyltransferase [Nitrospirae bacterium]|nr:glycosyltransferase [Nitrospirota bacterium]